MKGSPPSFAGWKVIPRQPLFFYFNLEFKMSGRRHHFLPQFLQRPFSTRRSATVDAVCVHRRDKSFSSNLTGVGQERDFYGGPDDPSLDEAITKGEQRLAAISQSLVQVEPSSVQPQDAAILISAISMRTKAMRGALTKLVPLMMEEMISRFKDVDSTRNALRLQAEEPGRLDQMFDEELKKRPPISRETESRLRAEFKVRFKKEYSNTSSLLVADTHAFVERALGHLQSVATDMADRAYIQAMKSDPLMSKRVERLSSFSFQVISGQNFILGDCGVITLHSDGRPRLAMGAVSSETQLDAFMLPISPHRCIVAARRSTFRVPDPDCINEMSASLSSDFFISNNLTFEGLDRYRALINTASPIDPEETIREHLRRIRH